MSFRQFLRYGIWDILLCALAGGSLAFIVTSGFYASVFLRSQVYVIAIAALVVSTVLYCISFNARTAAFGSLGVLVAFIVVMVVCVQASTSSSLFADEEGNYALACVLVFAPLLLTFLLTRKRMLCAVLLVVGVFAAAIIEYLYAYGDVIPLVLFGLSAIVMSIYRTYLYSLMDSESDAMAFNSVALGGLVLGVLSVALGLGVFALVIAPLNPPAAEIKLITEHYRIEYEHVRGIGESADVQNDDLYSNELSDEEQMANRDVGDIESKQDQNADGEGEDDADTTGTSGNAQGILLEQVAWWALIVLLVVLLIVLLVVLVKRLLRRRWYAGVVAKPNDEQVREFYLFFLERFRRLKIVRPQGQTLAEFTRNYDDKFAYFERTAPAGTFGDLTQVYTGVVYGDAPASDEAATRFRDYYAAFYKNARGYVGRLRYLVKFLVL